MKEIGGFYMDDDVDYPEPQRAEPLRGHRLIPADSQDALDGAALRRLREALPEGFTFELEFAVNPERPPWAIDVYAGANRYPRDWCGNTIAEAADKCREVLERSDDQWLVVLSVGTPA